MAGALAARWDNWKMDGFVKGFILASMGWLTLGASLGLAMAVHDAAAPAGGSNWTWLLLPTHTHLMVIGWVSMMIFGVGYHMIPRFSGVLVWSPRLAWWHLVLANLGLAGMGLGFWLNRLEEDRWGWLLGAGGTAQFTAIGCFIVNLLVTIWKAGEPRIPTAPAQESLAVRLAGAGGPKPAGGIHASWTPALVLAEYPRTLQVFLAFGFSGLADPEHVRTMGSRITLAQAAARHSVNVGELVRALNGVAGTPIAVAAATSRPLPMLKARPAVEPCCPECAEKEIRPNG